MITQHKIKPFSSKLKLKPFSSNFWARNATKSIKGSKDSYYSLESKKTWETTSLHWIGRWRHEKNRKTGFNHDPMDPKPQTTNLKIFFKSKLHHITKIQRVCTAL